MGYLIESFDFCVYVSVIGGVRIIFSIRNTCCISSHIKGNFESVPNRIESRYFHWSGIAATPKSREGIHWKLSGLVVWPSPPYTSSECTGVWCNGSGKSSDVIKKLPSPTTPDVPHTHFWGSIALGGCWHHENNAPYFDGVKDCKGGVDFNLDADEYRKFFLFCHFQPIPAKNPTFSLVMPIRTAIKFMRILKSFIILLWYFKSSPRFKG